MKKTSLTLTINGPISTKRLCEFFARFADVTRSELTKVDSDQQVAEFEGTDERGGFDAHLLRLESLPQYVHEAGLFSSYDNERAIEAAGDTKIFETQFPGFTARIKHELK